MTKHLGILLTYALCAFSPVYAYAAQDRAEVEARVRAGVTQDLSEELQLGEWITGRVCLDGRATANFPL